MTAFALCAIVIGVSILATVVWFVSLTMRHLTEIMNQHYGWTDQIPSFLRSMTFSVEESEIDLEEHSSHLHLAVARLMENETPTSTDLPVLGYEISSTEDFESIPSQ